MYGQPANETITINEDSIWSGPEENRLNTIVLSSLGVLRTALLENNVTGAADIAYANFTSNPTTSREYVFLADLVLTFDHSSYTNYERVLDLQNALVTVSYEVDGTPFTREWIASYPQKVIVGSLTSSTSGGLSFTAQWNRTGLYDGTRLGNVTDVGQNASVILAGFPGGAPNYAGMFAVVPSGGSVSISNGTVTVTDADSAIIVISAETDYWNDGFSYAELQDLVQSQISNAISTGFPAIYSEHTSDYQYFFNRTVLNVESPATNYSLDITGRYDAYISGATDQALETLLFYFGRYLIISSSRAGSLPPNLVGIWNPENNPAWGGKFTTDLNVEMNYWLTETTGLSEMSYQLVNFTQNRVVPNGGIQPRPCIIVVVGARIITTTFGEIQLPTISTHHLSRLAKKKFNEGLILNSGTAYKFWPMGGAWPMTHLYEHYRFTGDMDFLKDTALPLLPG